MRYSILFLLFWLNSHFAQAQQSDCKNIYVWDFTTQDGQKNDFTKDLTNAAEEALVNVGGCSVLQRRNFANIQSQLSKEILVQSTREIADNKNISKNLNTIGAELVVFGTLNIVSRKEFELQLRIENLTTTKILRMRTSDLDINDLVDGERKRVKLDELVGRLVGAAIEKTHGDPDIVSIGSVKNCLTGYNVLVRSCTRKAEQKVEVILEFKHELANQSLGLQGQHTKAYANAQEFEVDDYFVGSRGASGTVPTDTPITATFLFRNIVPTIPKLNKIFVQLWSRNLSGGSALQQCILELDNLTIK